MKLALQTILPIGILIAGGFTFFLVLDRENESKNEPFARKERSVRALYVTPRMSQFPIETSGFVRAHTRSVLSAEVAGKIVETSGRFYVGEFFKAGDELLKIDPTDYETALEVARSQVTVRKLLLEDEERQIEEALDEWKKRNRGKDEEDAPPEVKRESALEAARSQLIAAEAELAKAEANLKRTIIRAPYDALLVDKQAGIGQVVSPGVILATLIAVDHAEVRLPIDHAEMRLLDLPRGPYPESVTQNTEIELQFEGGQRRGTIVRTENAFDERTRSIYAIAKIEDPYLWFAEKTDDRTPLAVGQFVKAIIPSRPIPDLVELPLGTLRGKNELVVVEGFNRLSIRQIELVYETGDRLFVRGLSTGDKVVLTSPRLALEGERVKVELEYTGDQVPGKAISQIDPADLDQ